VFHGDLATRNALVLKKYVVKITDFGMSRKLYDYAAYTKKTQVFHGDLATRNALVLKKYVVKITDFGMSRKLYDYAAYTKKTQVNYYEAY
ncbi:unnamed protein product, partial [Allacma fusca]